MSRGRALGPGTLRRVQRGAGHAYRLEWTDARGVRRRKLLGADRRVAEQQRGEIIRDRDLQLRGLKSEDRPELELRKLVDRFLLDLRPRVARSTHEVYGMVLEKFLRGFPCRYPSQITVEDYSRYREGRRAAGTAHSTLNRELDVVRSVLRFGEIQEVVAPSHPLFRLSRLAAGPAHATRRRRAMSDAEIAAFLQACRQEDLTRSARWGAERTIANGTKGGSYAGLWRRRPIPQAPFWLTLLETGARFGELTATVWKDLDVERRTLSLRPEHTKSRRGRIIPLRDALVGELRQLRAAQAESSDREPTDQDPIFLTPSGMPWSQGRRNALTAFRRILTAAGIPRRDADGRTLDIHALRHTFGSRLARSGAPLIQAQKLLGHSDPKLTAQVYTHLDAEDLRGAIEMLDPAPVEGHRELEEARGRLQDLLTSWGISPGVQRPDLPLGEVGGSARPDVFLRAPHHLEGEGLCVFLRAGGAADEGCRSDRDRAHRAGFDVVDVPLRDLDDPEASLQLVLRIARYLRLDEVRARITSNSSWELGGTARADEPTAPG